MQLCVVGLTDEQCDAYATWYKGSDVAPVKHGHWDANNCDKDYWDSSCSVCGIGVDFKVYDYMSA